MLGQKVYLYVPWTFDRLGGVDVVVDNVFKAGNEQGFDIAIAEQSWEPFAQKCDSDGRKFVSLNLVSPPAGAGAARVRSYMSFAKHSVKTLFQLRRQRVGVINVHFPTKLVYMLCVLKKLKLWRGKLVLSFHGSDVNALEAGDKIWANILNTADSITVCSNALRVKLLSRIDSHHLPIRVIHNGINADYLTSCLERPMESAFAVDGEYILCVANFVENKGQDILVKAFAILIKSRPYLKLVLAGGRDNGVWVERLKDLAKSLNVLDSLIFLFDVPHESVPALMRDAKILVLPSKYESFGLVVAESGLVATPVIASDVGGIPEIIPSSAYGALVPVGSVNLFVTAIEYYIKHPEMAANAANKLQDRVIRDFSSKNMCKQYLNCF